jgi:biotin carboxylase
MVVTAGSHQRPLITAAKAMGCEVLATDRRAHAPALTLADHAAIADATSLRDLLCVAHEFRPDAVLTEQTDVGVPGAAYVAEHLGIAGIGYETALRATDKWRMREACRDAGVPMPEYRLATSIEEAIPAARDIGFPAIVKPTDNQSSRGVSKVVDIAALPAAFKAARAASRSGRVLVEECMTGRESSIESFLAGETVQVLAICEKVTCAPPYCFGLQHIYPAPFSPDLVDEIKDLNCQVIRAIGIRMGFTHAEVMVTANGVKLIEIAARGCGARVATDLLPALTGVDLLRLRLRQALGEQVQIPPIRNTIAGILQFLDLPSGTVRRIGDLRAAAAVPGVIHLELDAKVGTRLAPPVSADQRPGFVLATARSREQVIAVAHEVKRRLAVEVA